MGRPYATKDLIERAREGDREALAEIASAAREELTESVGSRLGKGLRERVEVWIEPLD